MKKIYLIDGNSFIYRMFYALPEFSTKDGTIINAVFGMAKFFLNQLTKENPDYLVFITDAKGKNFRHEIYPEYKATRDRMPDNLRAQISLIYEMIKKMGIDIIEIPNCEADDVIGTLANNLKKDKNNEIYILSGDKDLYSLIDTNVLVYDTQKQKKYDEGECEKKFGVKPEFIVDYLSIVGDSADNIPGLPGFGPKKAIDLISKYGNLENIYSSINEKDFIIKGKTHEKLNEGKDLAFLSKKLATIKKNIILGDFLIKNYVFKKENILNENVKDFFVKYEFYSLYKEEKNFKSWNDLGLKVKLITNDTSLNDLKNKIKHYKEIFLDTETTSLNIIDAQLVGISIYLDDDNIYYINYLHEGEKVLEKSLKDFLKYLFSLDIKIIGHNLKYDLEIIELFLSGVYYLKHNKKESIGEDNNTGQISLKI